MSLSSLILENRWLLEVIYALTISSICLLIFSKTNRLFNLSSHQGIRYFRNAFFFYGIAFVGRYIFGVFSDMSLNYSVFVQALFEYFLIMAGFFLLYSLIWRKFEAPNEEYLTSIINKKVFIFHAMAFIIAALDTMWMTYDLMFISQIIIFAIASIISFKNYKKSGSKHNFLKFSFVAMLLELFAWTFNLLVATYFQWSHKIMLGIGIANIIFFFLILYGVLKATRVK